MVIASVVFVGHNLYTGYLVTIWGGFSIGVITLLQYFCYKQIMNSISLGLGQDAYSIYIDIMGVNISVQV